MSAKLYYWDGVSPVRGYGSVKNEGGAEILFNTAKNYHFKNKKEVLTLVVEDALVLLDGKVIPLSRYLGEMQITKGNQDKVILNDLFISRIPRINTKLYQRTGFGFGTLAEYREAYGYMVFEDIFQESLNLYPLRVYRITDIKGCPDGAGIGYSGEGGHYVEVHYDKDAFVKEICIDREYCTTEDKLMRMINQLLDLKDGVPAAPTLFDVCIDTLVRDAKRKTLSARMFIDYRDNRPSFLIDPICPHPDIAIPSQYGVDYCKYRGSIQQVADMDNDTLVQALQSIPEEKLTTMQRNAIKRCCELVKEYDDLTASLEMEGEER